MGSDNRILITGGRGFIGRALCPVLTGLGYEVHTVGRTLPEADAPPGIHHVLDILNPMTTEAFLAEQRFSTLVHLAWYMGPKCHIALENLDYAAASISLVRAFARHGGAHFLGAGSITEYDYANGYLREDSPLTTTIAFGCAKSAVCRMAQILQRPGFVVQWARIFNLYGPWEAPKRLMPSVIMACLRGEPVRVSTCDKYQDYLHVADVAAGLATLVRAGTPGIYNICSGRPVWLRTIVETITQQMDATSPVEWGALPEAFSHKVLVGNNQKITDLGWKPTLDIDAGLRQTITWWQKYQCSP